MGRVSESAGLGKRDNDCFGSGIEDFQIHEEFDFEKNLALFDKVMNIFLQRNLPSKKTLLRFLFSHFATLTYFSDWYLKRSSMEAQISQMWFVLWIVTHVIEIRLLFKIIRLLVRFLYKRFAYFSWNIITQLRL